MQCSTHDSEVLANRVEISVGMVVVGTGTDRWRKQWIRRRGLWLADVV